MGLGHLLSTCRRLLKRDPEGIGFQPLDSLASRALWLLGPFRERKPRAGPARVRRVPASTLESDGVTSTNAAGAL